MFYSSEYERNRANKRNKRVRAENDHNRVLNEYIMLKYGPISDEFNEFYEDLKDKYPDKSCYKGSKKFRVWVQDKIKKYDTRKNPEGETITVEDEGEQNISLEDEGEAGGINLNKIVESTIGAEVEVPGPLENIIANGNQSELEELNALVENIIADLENQTDEGISLSPEPVLEVDPFYYDHEIEGLDDLELDIPTDRLEIELENY